MPTFTDRKKFTRTEIGAIRKKFHEIEDFANIKFEMCVDGHNLGKVDYGHETFFRFSSPSYAIEMWPMNVRHKRNEPAVGIVIRSYGPNGSTILDLNIANSVKPPEAVLEDAYAIVEDLEIMRVAQSIS